MISKGFSSVSVSDIRKVYTDDDIVSKYLHIKVPCLINSPFRKDEKPSLSLYRSLTGNIYYKDFSTSERGNIFDFLSRLWGVSFNTVISRIASESNVSFDLLAQKSTKRIYKPSISDLQVKVRKWKDHDLEFWNTFGITKAWLEFGDVYPIESIFFSKDGVTKVIPADKWAYAYVERKDGVVTMKIYQPFSKMKWLSKHDSSVWDLWSKIPERGERLIITSSRKDALCVWANTGIPSLSLQGEGYMPKEHVVNELKERYNKVYVLYDNDFKAEEKGEENHGRVFGKKLADTFGLIQIEIPGFYKSKDPSDLYKDWGKDVFNTVMQSLIA